MRPDRRRIDQDFSRWPAGTGESMENTRPHALRRPPNETVVERLARAVDRRRVGPPASRLQDMHDPADHPPVIDPRLAPRIGRKKRRKPRELLIGKPKIRTRHGKLLSRSLNHIADLLGIPFMGPEPNKIRFIILDCRLYFRIFPVDGFELLSDVVSLIKSSGLFTPNI